LSSNFVEVSGVLSQIDTVRYTPAGVALLNAEIEHQSEQIEAGMKRKIEQSFRCRFAGPLALQASKLSLGREIKVKGFLASAKRGSMSLIVHVQSLVEQTST
jgi:primosomal replication protein N